MNEDETTQTLSDKVLDRANVLRFGKPAERRDHEKPSMARLDSGQSISAKAWKSWKKKDSPILPKEWTSGRTYGIASSVDVI